MARCIYLYYRSILSSPGVSDEVLMQADRWMEGLRHEIDPAPLPGNQERQAELSGEIERTAEAGRGGDPGMADLPSCGHPHPNRVCVCAHVLACLCESFSANLLLPMQLHWSNCE